MWKNDKYSNAVHKEEAVRLVHLANRFSADYACGSIKFSDGITRPDLIKALIKLLKPQSVGSREIPSLITHILYNGLDVRDVGTEHKSQEEKEMKAYRWIPYDNYGFYNQVIKRFTELSKKRFIDVGSGLGTKVMLASLLGHFDSVSGIELNDHTYHVGAYLTIHAKYNSNGWRLKMHESKEKKAIHLIHGNALTHDYGMYDAVYLYMPISDSDTLNDLHLQIINTMPVGGTMIEVGRGYFDGGRKQVHTCGSGKCTMSDTKNCTLCKRCCDCGYQDFTWDELCEGRLKRKVDINHDWAWEITVLE
jgi:hypothetical protein